MKYESKMVVSVLSFLLILVVDIAVASCVPGEVTCCFTFNTELLQVWVDDIELTSLVTPSEAFDNVTQPKFITFTEPPETAVIAVRGVQPINQQSAIRGVPSLNMMCTCTRPESPWNAVNTSRAINWRTVHTTNLSGSLPENWWSLTYTGTTTQAVNATDLAVRYAIDTTQCASTVASRIRVSGQWWGQAGFRRIVNQTTSCGTRSPTFVTTSMPSSSPTTASPSASPTPSPTRSPTTSPTRSPICAKPEFVDIVWVLDGSSSMQEGLPGLSFPSKWDALRSFLLTFVETLPLGVTSTRMGLVRYAGEFVRWGVYQGFQLIDGVVNVTDLDAVSVPGLQALLAIMNATGGVTNTAGALDYVRTTMFHPGNYRPRSHRIVILVTDGLPTNAQGMESTQAVSDAENAAQHLKDEDDVVFVLLRFGPTFPQTFLMNQSDFTYNTSFQTLDRLLREDFLCVDLTLRPTPSPTASPSRAPSLPTPSPTYPQTNGDGDGGMDMGIGVIIIGIPTLIFFTVVLC